MLSKKSYNKVVWSNRHHGSKTKLRALKALVVRLLLALAAAGVFCSPVYSWALTVDAQSGYHGHNSNHGNQQNQLKVSFQTQKKHLHSGDIMVSVARSEEEFNDLVKNDRQPTCKGCLMVIKSSEDNKEITINLPNEVKECAIVAYQDLNGNGKLDKGPFGPKEPVGFSQNPSHRFGPPSYKDAKVEINGDMGIEIQMG